MQTTVNLPDSLYEKSETLVASRGATVEQFIVEAVKKEVQGNLGLSASGSILTPAAEPTLGLVL